MPATRTTKRSSVAGATRRPAQGARWHPVHGDRKPHRCVSWAVGKEMSCRTMTRKHASRFLSGWHDSRSSICTRKRYRCVWCAAYYTGPYGSTRWPRSWTWAGTNNNTNNNEGVCSESGEIEKKRRDVSVRVVVDNSTARRYGVLAFLLMGEAALGLTANYTHAAKRG